MGPAPMPAVCPQPGLCRDPQLTALRCLWYTSFRHPVSTETSWVARERYMRALSARIRLRVLFASFWSVSEKGEVAVRAGTDLWQPAELVGWPGSAMTSPAAK